MVADLDGDGVADVRFGMVNTSDTEHRDWRTDLATGVTDPDEFLVDSYYPSQDPVTPRQQIAVSRSPKIRIPLLPLGIADLNGQVVATDYAPNEGWIEP